MDDPQELIEHIDASHGRVCAAQRDLFGPIAKVDDALRLRVHSHRFGPGEVLPILPEQTFGCQSQGLFIGGERHRFR